jgi:hypothetical protein
MTQLSQRKVTRNPSYRPLYPSDLKMLFQRESSGAGTRQRLLA